MSSKIIICTICPKGCEMKVMVKNSQVLVTGNKCNRGKSYAIEEMTNPKRILTSTVKVNHAFLDRLPVRSNGYIPKSMIFKAMEVINEKEIDAPIRMGDIIIKDILRLGIDIIASRSMNKEKI